MRNRLSAKTFAIYCLLFTVFLSCQKVININLNSSASKLVVEGDVNNLAGPYTFKLSRTSNYFDNSPAPAETGALVIISDNGGTQDTLHEGIPGTYSSSHLSGACGKNYSLYISSSGKQYTASQIMMDSVAIDSVSYQLRVSPRSQTAQYSVTLSFTDPLKLGNYYGFRVYHNRTIENDIMKNRLINDQLSNGDAFHMRFRSSDWKQNDTVRVELISFSKNAYDFYNTIKQTLEAGSPFSAPPANPVTDITNGALGFFGVYAITSRQIILK